MRGKPTGVGRPMKIWPVLLLCVSVSGCVSSGDDYRVAAQVGGSLAATRLVPEDTREAERIHKGRMVYFRPGVKGNPHVTYYEVTSTEDMALLQAAAEKALLHVADANTVTLHFMEKQVFKSSPSGGRSRGREKQIRKIVVRRRAPA